MERMDTDGDGGFYRGEYYEEKQMALIREAEKVRASIESRREILIARGDDPEAMLAAIDAEMDKIIAGWADLRATQDALLDADVEEANARLNFYMGWCRYYLPLKKEFYERLAKVPPAEREEFLDIFEQLEAFALGCFDALPIDDQDALRRDGWRDEWGCE